ncbi:MAG: DUF1444 family protein [Planctomycetota bacterium]|nr:DUF1444 family protein [Planctomycetota bacterium]
MTAHVPEHWTRSIGPSNWFTLRHPSGWNSQTDGNILHLTSSDDRLSLTLYSTWLAPAVERLQDHSLLLEEIFPVRRNVVSLEPLAIPQENLGVQGEAVLGPETPWWQRAATSQEWRRWRVRAIKCHSLCVMVIYLQDEEFDPEADTIMRLVMRSIEFSEPLADPPSMFADRVLSVARHQYPEFLCTVDDQLQLRLGDSTINLFNVYRRYTNSPEQFHEIVQPTLETLHDVQNWSDSRLNPGLDEIRNRIMPMLYPASTWKKQFFDFAAQTWVAGLAILYVVDETDAYWYVRQDLIESWGLSVDDLHAIALTNLNEYFAKNPMELLQTGEPGGPQLLLPQRPDAYNSARLLSTTFHASLQEILGREFVAGVPNRDFFVAVSLDSDDVIQQVRAKVVDDHNRMDHPLSKRLLLISSDGVSEFVGRNK